MPFIEGQSGNPAGRPRGARNKATLAAQALLDEEAETITRKVIELAKAGDITAIKLVMERIIPPRKEIPISFELPSVNRATDLAAALGCILQAASLGHITLSEAQQLASIVENYRKTIEFTDIAERIEALETRATRPPQQRGIVHEPLPAQA